MERWPRRPTECEVPEETKRPVSLQCSRSNAKTQETSAKKKADPLTPYVESHRSYSNASQPAYRYDTLS